MNLLEHEWMKHEGGLDTIRCPACGQAMYLVLPSEERLSASFRCICGHVIPCGAIIPKRPFFFMPLLEPMEAYGPYYLSDHPEPLGPKIVIKQVRVITWARWKYHMEMGP